MDKEWKPDEESDVKWYLVETWLGWIRADKAWFEELAKKKKELQALEEETRRDIGLSE